MEQLIPLLIVALIVWAGVYLFLFSVDRKIHALERHMHELMVASNDGTLSAITTAPASTIEENVHS